MPVIQVLGKSKRRGGKFKGSLNYIARSSLNGNNNNNKL